MRYHMHHHRARWSRFPFGHAGMGGHHRGRRGGRLGRMFEHGDLRHVLLALLAEKPSHGYELMRELEGRTGGAYRPSPGVVYPTLAMLEDEGLIRPAGGESGRKLFEVTDAGRASLEQQRATVDAIFARLNEAAAASALASPKVLRAMENLKTALRLRLSNGPVAEGQIEAIAAALDEAAAKVERI
jgi:DNA-binding PadR family transcriptional regulator